MRISGRDAVFDAAEYVFDLAGSYVGVEEVEGACAAEGAIAAMKPKRSPRRIAKHGGAVRQDSREPHEAIGFVGPQASLSFPARDRPQGQMKRHRKILPSEVETIAQTL